MKSQYLLLGLTASVLASQTVAGVITLTNAEAVTDIAGDANSAQYFMLDVPEGATDLAFTINGGSGDVDLYVKAGERPTLRSFDCRPYLYGNNERCTGLTETNIPYYVMLNGYSAYDGVTLLAQYSEAGSGGDTGGGAPAGECELTQAQMDLLALHNAARSERRSCGGTNYEPAPELTWNCKLATAAANHNQDMAVNNFFSHTGSDGSQPWDRAKAAGYQYSYVGENIAAGYPTAEDAMAGWLKSSGHCSNIMNPNYRELGANMLPTSTADYPYYWTAVYGRSQ